MSRANFHRLRPGDRVCSGGRAGSVYFAGRSYESFCVGVHWDDPPEGYAHSSWVNEGYRTDVRRLAHVGRP